MVGTRNFSYRVNLFIKNKTPQLCSYFSEKGMPPSPIRKPIQKTMNFLLFEMRCCCFPFVFLHANVLFSILYVFYFHVFLSLQIIQQHCLLFQGTLIP